MAILNFGPAAITFTPGSSLVSTSVLPGGIDADFESAFAGWTFSPSIAVSTTDSSHGSQAIKATFSPANGYSFSVTTSIDIPVIAGVTYHPSFFAKTTVTELETTLKVFWLNSSDTIIQTDTQTVTTFSTYSELTASFQAPAGAVNATMQLLFASASSQTGYICIDNASFSHHTYSASGSPVSLPKTNEGTTLNLNTVSWTSMPSNTYNEQIIDGTGVIHFYNWPSDLNIASDLTLYDYGTLTLLGSTFKITLHSCKLLLSPSFSIGTSTQKTIDVNLSIRPHPSTDQVITIEDV